MSVDEFLWKTTNVDLRIGSKTARLLEPGKLSIATENAITNVVRRVINGPEPRVNNGDQPVYEYRDMLREDVLII